MKKEDSRYVNEAMYYMKSMGLDYNKFYEKESDHQKKQNQTFVN